MQQQHNSRVKTVDRQGSPCLKKTQFVSSVKRSITLQTMTQFSRNQFVINNKIKKIYFQELQQIFLELQTLNQLQMNFNKMNSNPNSEKFTDIVKDKLVNQQQINIQIQRKQELFSRLDEIIIKEKLGFFIQIRKLLEISEYHQMLSQCRLKQVNEANKVIIQKGKYLSEFYVLLDGVVSYNEEKIVPNTSTAEEEAEYTQVFIAQKGELLNSQTINGPKYNPYTILSKDNYTLLITIPSAVYLKLLKKPLNKLQQQKSYQLSHTSLFRNISTANIKHFLPYFFNSNYYKYNETIYQQNMKAEYVYFILQGEVELLRQDKESESGLMSVYKIVKLSKYEIFGIDQYVKKPGCEYKFTAHVSSEYLRTICISYRTLNEIQNVCPCLNENVDFYLKRAVTMHSKLCQKNQKIMDNKESIRMGYGMGQNKKVEEGNGRNFSVRKSLERESILAVQPHTAGHEKKKKNKNKKKKNKKNPSSMQWWGLAENMVGNRRYKFHLPKFITNKNTDNSNSPSKLNPMFDTQSNMTHKIQQFRRRIFEHELDSMIENDREDKQNDESPYKVDYVPKLNKMRIRMVEVKPKAIDNAQRIKKNLLYYAKNGASFCEKLNLD